ncbi:hypothetical protein COU17_01755 [Candidatus Kaiserbacteria bacterium CG10_big_fil_rev_8_21_14_0_10_49_17]|uniref:Uncharacterized protein n=1 Tax=Candidatus Kaiserbacteria bacterium CG10_big_fil_rev_8_21_14_0_10_49_17 TaxID=1974609 RepID=A0A2M6WEP4_9BACT|nr:MAG: hypothetical protein COU17_01755 [Candidatus Kaiserbacteria bacterium CG10_big_fil_rev_8_21_14_0_10_49_17]
MTASEQLLQADGASAVLIARPKASASTLSEEEGEELSKIAKDIGLPIVADRYSSSGVSALFSHVKMSDDELLIWQTYCPTKYRDTEKPRHREKKLRSYQFDTIPPEVLRLWDRVKDIGFDEIQIWTTEKTPYVDPVLVGTLGEDHFLLARWGEESPDTLSFNGVLSSLRREKLKEEVEHDIRWNSRKFSSCLTSFWVWIFTFLGGSLLLSSKLVGLSTWTALVLACIASSCLVYLLYRFMYQRLTKLLYRNARKKIRESGFYQASQRLRNRVVS